MDGDKRKTYAASLTVEGYNHLETLRQMAGLGVEGKPSFVISLEQHLKSFSHGQQGQQGRKRRRESGTSSLLHASEVLTPWNANLQPLPAVPTHFEDIDWLFWSLPSDDQLLADFGHPKSADAGKLQSETS